MCLGGVVPYSYRSTVPNRCQLADSLGDDYLGGRERRLGRQFQLEQRSRARTKRRCCDQFE